MPEPTDPRAEAESWLRVAEVEYARAKADPVVTMAALIGIGHALLALHHQGEQRQDGPAWDMPGVYVPKQDWDRLIHDRNHPYGD